MSEISRPGVPSVGLDRLPDGALGVPELDSDPAWRLAAAFLVGFRGHTRRAYFNDIRTWYAWCAAVGVYPLDAQRHHVDRWITTQTELPQPKTGKPAAAATVARRLSCLAGLYEYAVVDAGLIDPSPVVRASAPRCPTTHQRSAWTRRSWRSSWYQQEALRADLDRVRGYLRLRPLAIRGP